MRRVNVFLVAILILSFSVALEIPNFFGGADLTNMTSLNNKSFLQIYSGTTTSTNSSLSNTSTESFLWNSSSHILSGSLITSLSLFQAYNDTWLDFDTTNYVDVPYSSELDLDGSTSNYTFITKFKQTNDSGGSQSLGGNKDTSAQGGISVFISGLRAGFFMYNDTGSSSNSLTASGQVALDTWYHLAGVYNGTHSKVYLNGVLNDTDSAVTIGDSDSGWRLGKSPSTSLGINGSLDYFIVYNESLSEYDLQVSMWNDGLATDSAEVSDSGTTIARILLNDQRWMGATGDVVYLYDKDGENPVEQFDFTGLGMPVLSTQGSGFQDSNNNTYLSFYLNKTLWRSPANQDGTYNLSNWQPVMEFVCSTGHMRNDNFDEFPDGTLLVGEYSDNGDADRNCSNIWRSTDEGLTWQESYFDSNEQEINDNIAHHVHTVKINPYVPGEALATMGDGEVRRKTIRTTDYGQSWTLLKSGNEGGYSWQPTTIQFLEDGRVIIGEDFGDNSEDCSKLIQTNYSDYSTYETVFDGCGVFRGYFGDSSIDRNNNKIYFALKFNSLSDRAGILAFDYEKNIFYWVADRDPSEQTTTFAGWSYSSDVNDEGCFYTSPFSLAGTIINSSKVCTKELSVMQEWRFNEGVGTTAYEQNNASVSGTLTNSPSWNNDGLNVTIQEGLYELNEETGEVVLEGGEYNFSYLRADYGFATGDSIYNYLVAYYPFEADDVNTTSFTMWDWSANNNGTSTGTAVVDTNGIYGNEYTNNNSDSYISVPYSTDLNMTGKNLTISFWANLGLQTAQSRVLGLQLDNSDYSELVWGVECSNSISCYADSINSSNDGNPGNAYTFTQDTWEHWVVIYEPGYISLYVNGVLESQKSVPFDTFYGGITGNFLVGAGKTAYGDRRLNGSIDEIMIFNTTLTEDNILAIYNNQSQRFVENGSIGYADQTVLNITAGDNRVNITNNFSALGGNTNISLSYYNGSWTTLTSQVASIENEFTIPTDATNLTINYTLDSEVYQFFSDVILSPISFETWNYTAPAEVVDSGSSSGGGGGSSSSDDDSEEETSDEESELVPLQIPQIVKDLSDKVAEGLGISDYENKNYVIFGLSIVMLIVIAIAIFFLVGMAKRWSS